MGCAELGGVAVGAVMSKRTSHRRIVDGGSIGCAVYVGFAVYEGQECIGRFRLRTDAQQCVAAPDMLEALKSIENDDERIPKTIWKLRNAAIAKAEGESWA